MRFYGLSCAGDTYDRSVSFACGVVPFQWGDGPCGRWPLGPVHRPVRTSAPSTAGAGSAEFDAAKSAYTISGGGLNTWANTDAFHYVWKKIPAASNISLAASVEFASGTAGADPHRKAFLMIRQSLDPKSPYADACLHGNGLTAIQSRDTDGDPTFETQAQVNAPKRLRIEKRGDYLSMSFGSSDQDLQPAGGACKVKFSGDIYVGIGVCAITPRGSRRPFSPTSPSPSLPPLQPIAPG